MMGSNRVGCRCSVVLSFHSFPSSTWRTHVWKLCFPERRGGRSPQHPHPGPLPTGEGGGGQSIAPTRNRTSRICCSGTSCFKVLTALVLRKDSSCRTAELLTSTSSTPRFTQPARVLAASFGPTAS